MHEIGALIQAIKLAEQVATENQISRVKFITLEIGELTGYLPVFFEKYFPVVIEDRPLMKDAKLHMKIVSGEALCSDCNALFNVMKHEGICPECRSRNKKIIGGMDFIVKDVGF